MDKIFSWELDTSLSVPDFQEQVNIFVQQYNLQNGINLIFHNCGILNNLPIFLTMCIDISRHNLIELTINTAGHLSAKLNDPEAEKLFNYLKTEFASFESK
jgi:hypothetical protein